MPYEDIDKELLAYIGGIMDGEGSISLCKSNRTREGNKNPSYSIRVSVSMCDKEIPELLYKTFGGSALYRKRTPSPLWKGQWDWVMSTKSAKEFLEVIIPYLRIERKIKTAKLCLEFQEEIGGKRYQRISDESLQRREELYLACKELNHRGEILI